jgi:hypothetical protein
MPFKGRLVPHHTVSATSGAVPQLFWAVKENPRPRGRTAGPVFIGPGAIPRRYRAVGRAGSSSVSASPALSRPDLLLMDEPFGAPVIGSRGREPYRRIQRTANHLTSNAVHDMEEAVIHLGDRVAVVMDGGWCNLAPGEVIQNPTRMVLMVGGVDRYGCA